jgi:3-oxoacyl-[acyl-carrier protein] reductase
MDLSLTGRHALVCGASEGIGRAAAFELAMLGADVTVLSRRRQKLLALASDLPRLNKHQHHGFLTADVSSEPDTLKAKIEALVKKHPVSILVNNTAGPPGGPIAQATPEQFLAVFQQHLVANHVLVQAVLPGMRGAGWGRIVNVVSTSVREPIAGLGVSNTVRGAVASWAKTLASEIGGDGITVNNVLPGFTRTARLDGLIAAKAAESGKSEAAVAEAMMATVPAGRFAEAGEIAAAIAFLASPAAGYINGVSLAVDGGRTRAI